MLGPVMRACAIAVAMAFPSLASADPVKMSTSGICHCPGGSYYGRTKNFTPYPSIDACLAAGGRHPKKGQGSCGVASSFTTPAPARVAPAANYDRALFGGWTDDDRDCQNTRHELLAELSTGPVTYTADGCRVSRGRWNDPYSGRIHFDAGSLDVDHLVPLAYAWAHGADQWPAQKRRQFANDPANLFAVEASANRQKGASGPLEWLPEDDSFHCQYLLRFTRVSEAYDLQMPRDEARRVAALTAANCR